MLYRGSRATPLASSSLMLIFGSSSEPAVRGRAAVFRRVSRVSLPIGRFGLGPLVVLDPAHHVGFELQPGGGARALLARTSGGPRRPSAGGLDAQALVVPDDDPPPVFVLDH